MTTNRCVSCGAKIARFTILVKAASAPQAACQTLIDHRAPTYTSCVLLICRMKSDIR